MELFTVPVNKTLGGRMFTKLKIYFDKKTPLIVYVDFEINEQAALVRYYFSNIPGSASIPAFLSPIQETRRASVAPIHYVKSVQQLLGNNNFSGLSVGSGSYPPPAPQVPDMYEVSYDGSLLGIIDLVKNVFIESSVSYPLDTSEFKSIPSNKDLKKYLKKSITKTETPEDVSEDATQGFYGIGVSELGAETEER